MKLLPIVVLAVPAVIAASGATIAHASLSVPQRGMTASLKKYKATITRQDERRNTKTFSDYCEAASYLEAQKTFEGRYRGAKVSGIIEVK